MYQRIDEYDAHGKTVNTNEHIPNRTLKNNKITMIFKTKVTEVIIEDNTKQAFSKNFIS